MLFFFILYTLSLDNVYVGSTRNLHLQKCLFLDCAYPEVFCKKGIVRNFAKFTGKSLF